MPSRSDHFRVVEEVLGRLPTESGGTAILLASSGVPPALALLSTGDVRLTKDTVRVGIHASSSAVRRLGGAFSLLVPIGESASRVEVVDATVTIAGSLALLSGRLLDVRPTAEIPWHLDMSFRPMSTGSQALLREYADYWANVRAWLAEEAEEPPPIPDSANE